MENATRSFFICRLPSVLAARGNRSRTCHYDDIKKGLWTRPVKCAARACGWPQHEVEALNAARIAGKIDEEIRELVAKLEAERKTALEEALK